MPDLIPRCNDPLWTQQDELEVQISDLEHYIDRLNVVVNALKTLKEKLDA